MVRAIEITVCAVARVVGLARYMQVISAFAYVAAPIAAPWADIKATPPVALVRVGLWVGQPNVYSSASEFFRNTRRAK